MRKVTTLVVGLAVTLSALPYALQGRWGLVLACVLAGSLWLVPPKFGTGTLPGLGALFLFGFGTAGQFLGVHPTWLLGQAAFTLAAWDLALFSRENSGFEGEANQQALAGLFRAHLARLGIVVITGWALGMAAQYLRLPLGFSGALVLGLLAFLGLRGISSKRRPPETGLERIRGSE